MTNYTIVVCEQMAKTIRQIVIAAGFGRLWEINAHARIR